MTRLRALPAALCIIATAGCDFFAPGSAIRPGGVNIDATRGQTGAEKSSDRLTVYFEARGNGALLSKAKAVGDETVWISEDLASLTERQGVVVGTQGLPTDLVSVETILPAAWDDLPAGSGVPVIHRHFSDAEGAWIRAYMCNRSPAQSVSIPAGDTVTTAWQTRLSCGNADRAFENTYWRDRHGTMMQSRQWLGDQLGYANLGYPSRGDAGQPHTPGDDP